MASYRQQLLVELSDIICEYRKDDRSIETRSPEIVDAWVQQFPNDVQEPLLQALVYVFTRTFITKDNFISFLTALANNKELSRDIEPSDYWKSVNFLDIQLGGASQEEILELFNDVLLKTHGYGCNTIEEAGKDYIYLDDCVGTGKRIKTDLCSWLENSAPVKSHVNVITAILHSGSYWVEKFIQRTAQRNGKSIRITPWRAVGLENRVFKKDQSDVLWPTMIPPSTVVQNYVKQIENTLQANKKRNLAWRNVGHVGGKKIFESDSQKVFLENVLLERGCQIRQEQSNLCENARPLGFHNLDCLGFGSMFITYRNCPNNCPLAFWVEQDEYPALLPRKTNTHTEVQKIFR